MSDSLQSRQTAVDETFLSATRNMLFTCGGVTNSARVLIVCEPKGLGYYDDALGHALLHACHELGLETKLTETDFKPEAKELPAALVETMAAFDMTVFLARIGDQVRFIPLPEGARAVVSYALSIDSMRSPFGTARHEQFVAIKALIESQMAGAIVHITCPNGTDIKGTADGELNRASNGIGEVIIRRFPMLVPRPVLADQFSGRAALCGFLIGTGNSYYEPYVVEFDGPLFAHFKRGQILEFEGSKRDVERANRHYDRVSVRLGVERNFVHSWHAGMHPACTYHGKAADNYKAWSGSAFGNPRLLHFHTCGIQPPGEISWNIVDPTISVNGINVWERGELKPERLPGADALLASDAIVSHLFRTPAYAIGL